jgi:hypothetical protein
VDRGCPPLPYQAGTRGRRPVPRAEQPGGAADPREERDITRRAFTLRAQQPRRARTLRRGALALVLASAASACAAGAERPSWVEGRFSEAEQRVDLLGVGSAPGSGPEAAETARQRALAAVLQQLSAQVSAQSTTRDSESSEQTRRDGETSASAAARTDRERTIVVTSAGELRGARFELASGRRDGAEVTWALARISREDLVRELAAEVRDALDAARRQLEAAEAALASPAPLHGGAPPPAVASGAVSAMAGAAALDAPRAGLPLIAAAAGRETAVHRDLAAELAGLADRGRSLSAEISRRLALDLAGPPPRLRLSGQLDALELRAGWDGAPLAALPVAARLGEGATAHALTDAEGRVTLQLPQAAGAPGTLRAGIALDGQLGPLATTLPVSVPAAASARVAVDTRHERDDGPLAARAPALQPSPLQAPLEAALGALHFLVATAPPAVAAAAPEVELRARLAGSADYLLVVTTRSAYRSREGRQQEGVLWYGTSLQVRFMDVASGEAFSLAIRETDSRDAGVNADQAASRSLSRALARLVDEQRSDTLPALLRARFR